MDQKVLRVNLEDVDRIECKACKDSPIYGDHQKPCSEFGTDMELRKVPATLSPTGREEIVPIMYFNCNRCGERYRDENGNALMMILQAGRM